MTVMNDLQHPQKRQEPTKIVREIFNTSHDIIDWAKKEEKKIEKKHKWVKNTRSVIHFFFLTGIIFVILILLSNWSAYSAFARAILVPEQLEQERIAMEGGLANTHITDQKSAKDAREERRKRILNEKIQKTEGETPELGASYFDQDVSRVSLSVNIAPYEDRIIIPKIGKNIPLVNVEHHDADTSNEWHKIFMKELENGIVKYPGSADPGQDGNSFIFGHSSNFPWAKGNYNDVFALLNELTNGDEIIVYFKQKKFVYVVKNKLVVKPGHVSSLGGDAANKQLTLMTCWPLGTTLNRLLVVTELKNTSETL
ncbi:class E sortase [Candidatus Gracilibacteria bacterium]|nr:class E sortase [Candidatus Gracilibacteria bacterium]